MDRRSFLAGLIAAPAIIPVRHLMALPRRPFFVPKPGQAYLEFGPFGPPKIDAAALLRVPAQIGLHSGYVVSEPFKETVELRGVVRLIRDGEVLAKGDLDKAYLPCAGDTMAIRYFVE